MRRIGRWAMLAASLGLVVGAGGAGIAQAGGRWPTCDAYPPRIERNHNLVTSTHTVVCTGYVNTISLSAELDGPGGYVSDQQSCSLCSSFTVMLSAPYATGYWGGSTAAGGDWGEAGNIATTLIR